MHQLLRSTWFYGTVHQIKYFLLLFQKRPMVSGVHKLMRMAKFSFQIRLTPHQQALGEEKIFHYLLTLWWLLNLWRKLKNRRPREWSFHRTHYLLISNRPRKGNLTRPVGFFYQQQFRNFVSVFLSVWRGSLQNRLSLLVCVSNAAHGVLVVNPR